MNLSKFVFAVLVSSMFFVSCSDDEVEFVEPPLGSYDNGAMILNQGGYGHGDASISYISNDISNHQNDIFSIVNPAIQLGDTGQDIGLYNDLAYIVLNVSNKIEIANRYTMKSIVAIKEGLNNPRFIAFTNGKGYVTNWGDGNNPDDDYIAVIDLTTNTVTSKIPVIEGPEKIVVYDGNLYVAHIGGYGYGNKISIINTSSNSVPTTINVGDVPNAMQIKESTLWVSCAGKPYYADEETPGQINKINLANNDVIGTYVNTDKTKHISNLEIEGNDAYFTIDAGIYKFDLNDTTLPSIPLFSLTNQGVYSVYSFAIQNESIYVGDAGDYQNNGKVYLYSMTGLLQKSFSVGVVPAGFYFNE